MMTGQKMFFLITQVQQGGEDFLAELWNWISKFSSPANLTPLVPKFCGHLLLVVALTMEVNCEHYLA